MAPSALFRRRWFSLWLCRLLDLSPCGSRSVSILSIPTWVSCSPQLSWESYTGHPHGHGQFFLSSVLVRSRTCFGRHVYSSIDGRREVHHLTGLSGSSSPTSLSAT